MAFDVYTDLKDLHSLLIIPYFISDVGEIRDGTVPCKFRRFSSLVNLNVPTHEEEFPKQQSTLTLQILPLSGILNNHNVLFNLGN